MANKLSLEVVTPFRTVLNEDVDSVTLPGIEGELGILPEHVPLLTTLDTGIMSYVNDSGNTQAIAVHWGYAQVDGNNVRVLAELAETADEIDLSRAQEAEKKAKELLQSGDPTASEWEDEESRQKIYENKLSRSVVRQAVAKFQ
jgi:F-type H+-transporting ATPase subunit epsilon